MTDRNSAERVEGSTSTKAGSERRNSDIVESTNNATGSPRGSTGTSGVSAQVPRQRRLRARRLRPEDLQLGALTATTQHASLGPLESEVEDLSLTGMALVVTDTASQASMVLSGDRLTELEVSCPAGRVYQGEAIVRRVSTRGDHLVLGIEVRAQGLDLGKLYRLGTTRSFTERMHAVLQDTDEAVPQELKAWVSDLSSFLRRAKNFLDSEEQCLEDLDLYSRTQAMEAYLETSAVPIRGRLTAAVAELQRLVEGYSDEQHSASRAYYKARLLPFLEMSPVLRRASVKPLGYAGDYEMMNMLYREPAEGSSLFSKAVNLFATQEPAARAVVNRLDYLSDKIVEAVRVRGRLRLASIGCGPARELAKVLRERPELGPYLDVALIDQEERVIQYCERTIGPLAATTGAKVRFIRESVRRLLTTRELSQALGERDLIYSAGLFDYLDGRSFVALQTALYNALASSGLLIVGNYSMNNPSRYFMEYCLDWFLIHRSPEDLAAFTSELSPAASRVEVETEALGINLFLNIWK